MTAVQQWWMGPVSSQVPVVNSMYVRGRTSIADLTGKVTLTTTATTVPGPDGNGWMHFSGSESDVIAVTPSDPADFDFSSGGWTMDMWVYLDNDAAREGTMSPLGCRGFEWLMGADEGYAGLNATYSSGGGARCDDNIPLGVATHIAFTYDGELTQYFNQGHMVVCTSTGLAGIKYLSDLFIGQNGAPGFPYNFKGYIREIRVSRNCRWTSDFTPDPGPYPI